MARDPLFLERRSYRQRRMMDAVRLLAMLGLAFWMVPLVWPVPGGADETIPMSAALRYIFGIWAALVGVAWVLWWRTRKAVTSDGAD